MVRANSFAFSIMLAIFPTIIFTFTLLPYIPIVDFDKLVIQLLDGILPARTCDALYSIVDELLSMPRGGLLSLGFFLALFFASNGMMSMMRGFDKSYVKSTFTKRSPLQKRWVAIKLTFLLALLLILAIAFILAGNEVIFYLLDLFQIQGFLSYALHLLRWFMIVILFYAIIATIYRYGPATREKFNWLTPGAALATILCILISVGFSYFVNTFNSYNKVYGSIGTLMVIMIWLQTNSFILLAGFELNASIAINKDIMERYRDPNRES